MVIVFWESALTDTENLVLVTGANGFVGSHLVEGLLARGYRVRCLVRRSSRLDHIDSLPVEWAYADLRHAEELPRACQGADVICHCAALTRALDRETFLQVNTRGTEVLARACLEISPAPRRFLYVSSQAAAGPSRNGDDVLDEARPPKPITWYGQSKWAAEQALLELADRLPVTIVRPAPVYGPRDRDFFAYFDLVQRGLSLQLGRHERRLSLIYVHDLVELLMLALKQPVAAGQTYFGCGPSHSYRELSAAIARALGKRPWSVTLPEAILTPIALWSRLQGRLTGQPALLNDQRVRDMRQRYWLCSAAKAQRELGFTARTDLETGVQETANWYLENGWL